MADSLSKIGAMLESARELTLEAASSASARLMDETPLKPKDISALLNGRSDRDRLSGMKQVITLMAKGENCAEYFPDVIKLVASSNLETRKLVYTYLLRYAEHEPDLALLSINTIQKSIGDQSPMVRSLAVRVMSGIGVPVIAPIVTLAIKQATNDLSPIVRKSAAQAIAKCYDLDPSSATALYGFLEKLLKDSSPVVSSAALVTLWKTFPDRLDMLHSIYRATCRMLQSYDEWTQIIVLDMLTRYARTYIAKPTTAEGTFDETDSTPLILDADLELLFENAEPLLYSHNGAVVLAVAKLYYSLGSQHTFEEYNVAAPVVRLLRGDASVQHLALINIRAMALRRQLSFSPYLTHFYVFPSESVDISKLKIEVLTLICTSENAQRMLSELKYYALHGEKALVQSAMQAIGRCALEIPSYSTKILKWLLIQVKSNDSNVVGESLAVIRVLVQRDFTNQVPTVVRLAKFLAESEIVASAKAAILWLVGELATTAYEITVEVLRIQSRKFAAEDTSVRYQLVLLAAKVYSSYLERQKNETHDPQDPGNEMVPKLFNHIMQLARYDTSYDTRDRARMFSSMLTSALSVDIATLTLQAPKPCPEMSLREILTKKTSGTTAPGLLMIGSSSLIVGHPLAGYAQQSLPNFTHPDELADPAVREEASVSTKSAERSISHKTISSSKDYEKNHGAVNGGKKLKEQSLDDFFSDIAVSAKPVLTTRVVEESSSSEEAGVEEESDDEEEDEYDDDEDEEDDDDDDDEEEEQEESSEEQDDEEDESDDDSNEKSNLMHKLE